MKKRIIKVIGYTILFFISVYLITIFLETIGYICIYRELCAGGGWVSESHDFVEESFGVKCKSSL